MSNSFDFVIVGGGPAGLSDAITAALTTALGEEKYNVPLLQAKANFHVCMIIGYNEATNEVAVSDSWGKRFEIRWVHVDEADAVSSGQGFVINL